MALPVAEPSCPEGDMRVTHTVDLLKDSLSTLIEGALPTQLTIQTGGCYGSKTLLSFSPQEENDVFLCQMGRTLYVSHCVMCLVGHWIRDPMVVSKKDHAPLYACGVQLWLFCGEKFLEIST